MGNRPAVDVRNI